MQRLSCLALTAYLAAATKYTENDLTKARSTEYLDKKGHNVDFSSMELPHSLIMKHRLDNAAQGDDEDCHEYVEGYMYHTVCTGHGWRYEKWYSWEYDIAHGEDEEFGYKFGNGWSKSEDS